MNQWLEPGTGLRLYLGCFCDSSRVGAPGDIAAEDAAENFGRALDLNADGTVVVVGARDNDDGGANSGEDDPHQKAPLESWLATHCGEKGDDKNPTKGKPQCVAMRQNL